MCIWEVESRFVLAKTEWLSPLLDVDLGEALRLLSALQWVCDFMLVNADFEMDSNVMVDNIYGRTLDDSNFVSIINDCRHLFSSDLETSVVRFIMKQINEVAHSLAWVTLCHASFRIFV